MTLTITLELTPEQEAELQRKAAKAGSGISGYLKRLADRSAAPRKLITQELRDGAELAGSILNDEEITVYWDEGIDAPTLARQLRRVANSRNWN
jgi:hypothetical protein